MSCRTWFLGFAASVATLLHAVEPWAVWTNFTGATANTGLPPQVSSTQNGINGGNWRLKLAGNASVTGGAFSKRERTILLILTPAPLSIGVQTVIQ